MLRSFRFLIPLLAVVALLAGCQTAHRVSAGDSVKVLDLQTRVAEGPQVPMDQVAMGGVFHLECVAPDGTIRWTRDVHNTVTTTGRNRILDIVFGSTAKDTWYMGLISSSAYSAISSADTLASHAGWTEGTPYAGNRPSWSGATGSAASQAITNSSAISFTINATLTVKGLFIASANTGTTGVLMSAALFSGGDASVVSGDTLNCTYTFSD